MLYEGLFITVPNKKVHKEVLNEYKKFIETKKGSIKKIDNWGAKRLAYEIENHHTGMYSLIKMDIPSKCLKELYKKIEEDTTNNKPLLRSIIIKVA